MTGHAMSAEEEEELAKEFSAGLDPKVAAAIRSVFYELRCQSAKAARACVACKSFWEQPNSSQWIKATAETLRAVKPHVAEMLLREIFLPLVRNEALLKDSDIASAAKNFMPSVWSSLSAALKEHWQLQRPTQELRGMSHVPDPLPCFSKLEAAHASSIVAFTRTACYFMTSFAGTDLPQAGLLEDARHNLLKRPAEAATGPRKRRKNRNKNRFSALEEEGVAEEPVGFTVRFACVLYRPPLQAIYRLEGVSWQEQEAMTDVEVARRPALVLTMMRDLELRENLLRFMTDLLFIPDHETITRALVGLATFAAQLWNMIISGEDLSQMSVGTSEKPQVGEILHTASDVLRTLPKSLVEPVAILATRSLDVSNGRMEGAVRQTWSAFTAVSWVEAKKCPSTLISECTNPICTSLMSLVKLFKLQCRKLELTCELPQLPLGRL